MANTKPEDIICAGCRKPITTGGVILSSTTLDGKMHANRAAHRERNIDVQSKFSEDQLTGETPISWRHIVQIWYKAPRQLWHSS